jgi:hypothetical protein
MVLARHTTSAEAVLQAGVQGLQTIADNAHIHCRRDTFHKICAWAEQAPPGHPQPLQLRRILNSLDDDRLAKTQQILELERDLDHLVVTMPYAILLAIPGINIVTVADLAGELGPIELYPDPNNITGRAGLVPSRYQSDEVDLSNGTLRRRGNRRLRAVLMQTADNLAQSNGYFAARAERWTRLGKNPKWIRVKIAKIFSRLAFAIVAGRQLFPHPSCQPRHYVLGKLLEFHTEHHTMPDLMRQDLEALTQQIPSKHRTEEAQPLRQRLDELAQRRRGPQPLANIIPLILARLGVDVVQSQIMRTRAPSQPLRVQDPTTPSHRLASRPYITLALCWLTTPDAAGWGPPLMYHVGDQVTRSPTEIDPVTLNVLIPLPFKKSPLRRPRSTYALYRKILNQYGRVM